MPVIDLSAYKPVPATLGDANQIASGFALIQSILNGIDNANFAAGKIFDPTKIMQNAATDGQVLVWNAAANQWQPQSVLLTQRDTTAVTIASSVTETDILGGAGVGVPIAAGALGTNRKIRLWVFWDLLNNTGGAALFTAKLYYGGTSWTSVALNQATSGNHQFGVGLYELMNVGATNAQVVAGVLNLTSGQAALPAAGAAGANLGAVDSTVAQNLRLTMTLGASSASLTFKKIACLVEII